MAELISCPVCAGKVSSEAPTCPHCGHPMDHAMRESAHVPVGSGGERQARSSSRSGYCGCLVLFALGLGLAFFIFGVIGSIG